MRRSTSKSRGHCIGHEYAFNHEREAHNGYREINERPRANQQRSWPFDVGRETSCGKFDRARKQTLWLQFVLMCASSESLRSSRTEKDQHCKKRLIIVLSSPSSVRHKVSKQGTGHMLPSQNISPIFTFSVFLSERICQRWTPTLLCDCPLAEWLFANDIAMLSCDALVLHVSDRFSCKFCGGVLRNYPKK